MNLVFWFDNSEIRMKILVALALLGACSREGPEPVIVMPEGLGWQAEFAMELMYELGDELGEPVVPVIASRRVFVEAVPLESFECAGKTVGGCVATDDFSIRMLLAWRGGCLRPTSFIHEIAHSWLVAGGRGHDGAHAEYPEVWRAVRRVRDRPTLDCVNDALEGGGP